MADFLKTFFRYGSEIQISKEGFQMDSGQTALSANEERTQRAPDNHNAASKHQFKTPSE